LWLQVRELAAVRREFGERGVRILREPRQEPWGLLEMWIADPDGVRICAVEVPAEHRCADATEEPGGGLPRRRWTVDGLVVRHEMAPHPACRRPVAASDDSRQ
jgi:glyoxalase/bleomycin resistance protein/dioxygenase superfamily protein